LIDLASFSLFVALDGRKQQIVIVASKPFREDAKLALRTSLSLSTQIYDCVDADACSPKTRNGLVLSISTYAAPL
jgi:hypothetical protein